MYQAGTLSGNPLAMTAGIATLELLKRPGTYDRLGDHHQAVGGRDPGSRAGRGAAH